MRPSVPADRGGLEGTVIATALSPGLIVASNVRSGRPGIREGTFRMAFAVRGNPCRFGASNVAATARLAVVLNTRSSALIEGNSVSAACGSLLRPGKFPWPAAMGSSVARGDAGRHDACRVGGHWPQRELLLLPPAPPSNRRSDSSRRRRRPRSTARRTAGVDAVSWCPGVPGSYAPRSRRPSLGGTTLGVVSNACPSKWHDRRSPP